MLWRGKTTNLVQPAAWDDMQKRKDRSEMWERMGVLSSWRWVSDQAMLYSQEK